MNLSGSRRVLAGDKILFDLKLLDALGLPAPSQELEVSVFPLADTIKGQHHHEKHPPRGWERQRANKNAAFHWDGVKDNVGSGQLPPGAFKGQFRVQKPGAYALHVCHKSPWGPLPGSPMKIEVVPKPAHPQTTRLPPDVKTQTTAVGDMGGFKFHALDEHGNKCFHGGAFVIATVDGHENDKPPPPGQPKPCTAWVTDLNNGAYVVR